MEDNKRFELVESADLRIWCFGCGYATSINKRDVLEREHMRHDGAHEPSWYTEETEARLMEVSFYVAGSDDVHSVITPEATDYRVPAAIVAGRLFANAIEPGEIEIDREYRL